jgi:hypothetical protein
MTEETKELHPAVALLLKRMDSNPQEFLEGLWANAEEAIAAYATDEERKLVEEKLGKLWMDHTHETMLKYLFRTDEDDFSTDGIKYKATVHPASSGVIVAGIGGGGSASNSWNTLAQNLTNKQMERMLNAAPGSLSDNGSLGSIYSQAIAQNQKIETQKLTVAIHKAKEDMLRNLSTSPNPPKVKHYIPKITPLERPLRILKGFFKHRA